MVSLIAVLIVAACASSVLGLNGHVRTSSALRLRTAVKMSPVDAASTFLDGSSSLLLNFLQRVEPEQAKGEFFFFFFGGSGALGIGAAQVPKIAKELDGDSFMMILSSKCQR